MLEVEMKFPAPSLSTLLNQLQAVGALFHETRIEIDEYFNAPDRDFAQTDEALRLRQVGNRYALTYKGPKRDLQTKTRTEIEVPLVSDAAAVDDLKRLLSHLGYRSVARVRKQRSVYGCEQAGFPVEICLDQVEGVGDYVELEILAPQEQVDAARQALRRLAESLGLKGCERRSYLELLLEKRKSPPRRD